MLKELRVMRRKGGHDRATANYVSTLQHKGIIKTYLSDKGYVAYDTKEYAEYRKSVKMGRPIKLEISEWNGQN